MLDNLIATAAAASLALTALPALADVKAGVDAWSRGDYVAAIRQWQGPAAEGDADAQFNLAQAYKLGKGVPADPKRAEELYLAAARQGHLQAADAYGLLLFQGGRRTEAMGWLVPAADRGEPRAQYVLGTAYFNGDLVARDPVRAYALMTRAAAAGLDQARASLALMDEAIPLEERQRAMNLATELDGTAAALRSAQLAAAELGGAGAKPERHAIAARDAVQAASSAPTPTAGLRSEPARAGADFAHPVVLATGALPRADWPKAKPTSSAAPAKAIVKAQIPAVAAPAPARDGAWRIQLGAFAVAGNAEALWARLKAQPALAGRERFLIAGPGLTRLQAGPFATRAQADAACAGLSGQACIAVRR